MPDVSNTIEKTIALVVITLVLLVMTNPIVDAVDDVNTTGWDFTGYEGAIILLDMIPFLWIAAVLSACAYGMFRLYKSGDYVHSLYPDSPQLVVRW